MKVGFLHVGPAEHGVRRYSETLSRAIGATAADVVDVAVPVVTCQALADAAARLATCDVVHVQYCHWLWGADPDRRKNVVTLLERLPAPAVVTVHDSHVDLGLPALARRALEHSRSLARRPRSRQAVPDASGTGVAPSAAVRSPATVTPLLSRARLNRVLGVEATVLRLLIRRSGAVLTCSELEAHHLRGLSGSRRLQVVPHYVEEVSLPARETARSMLELHGRVVTVLGFVHPRKGHDLAVEALPRFPSDVMLCFAGRATSQHGQYVQQLTARAAELGVSDRLVMTGPLSEERMAAWLAVTDLAVCPYRAVAASGSLGTLLAADRPILAFDVPYVRELDRWSAGAVAVFDEWSPAALADAVTSELTRTDRDAAASARRVLRDQLSLPRTAERHLAVYSAVLRTGR